MPGSVVILMQEGCLESSGIQTAAFVLNFHTNG
jgi:hypothetical protein